MQKSLLWKLTLAFVAVAIFTTALAALFIRITSVDRLTQLIFEQQVNSFKQVLVDYYTENGSWQGVAVNWLALQREANPNGAVQIEDPTIPGVFHERRSLFGLATNDGLIIIPVDVNSPAGVIASKDMLTTGSEVVVNGETVGVILMPRQLSGLNPEEEQFLERTNQALLLAVAGAALVALIAGLIIARNLTRPLKALTSASQKIAQGQLEQQVEVTSKDEVGQLAEAFNRMSQEVAKANQQRRMMTADIAHDLRTPLTVIGGYIESMRDGVLQPTPQRLEVIYSEIERLQHMVADLRLLSLADAGELPLNPQPLTPKTLLERAAAVFAERASRRQIELQVDTPADLPEINVDEARMQQIFDNVLANALRYTPEGGKITLSGSSTRNSVLLRIKDTGSGIPAEELSLIFDRFHRADPSRHADNGESGLGLAIVKALVESMRGKVWAESEPGHGTTILMEFPVTS